MRRPITSDKFTSPFRFLDAKVAEFQEQRSDAARVLRECGWILRPNHPITMVWRARRHANKKTEHLSHPTCAGLIESVRAEAGPRFAARRAREESAAAKKKAKQEKTPTPVDVSGPCVECGEAAPK